MHALIIGYGSIGARHAHLLDSMGHKVICVTRNTDCPYPVFASIDAALAENTPWLAIVSSTTVEHAANLQALLDADFSGRILVEKPLFETIHDPKPTPGDNVFVAYNLRFHPIVTRTRELLAGLTVLNAQFHVGQYLPDWRPGTDYTASYSASRAKGGGVLRDLSHELDLAQFLLGGWQRATAIGGYFSELDIDSDDQFSVLMQTRHCPTISLHMDYLSHTARRGFDITCAGLSLRADFINGTLMVNGVVEDYPTHRNTTYKRQLEALVNDDPTLCSYEQGLAVVALIEAIEESADKGIWVTTP